MSKAWKDLVALISEAGGRVTFDRGRSITHHCTFCDAPGPHALADIGMYSSGDKLTRPVCEACTAIADARAAPDTLAANARIVTAARKWRAAERQFRDRHKTEEIPPTIDEIYRLRDAFFTLLDGGE